MKKVKTPTNAAKGYAPDKKAFARLVAAGMKPSNIFEGEKKQAPDKFKMRKGEYLGVVNGLLAFGKGRRAMDAAVRKLHKEGAAVLDVETGLNSRDDGVQMMNEALDPPKPSPEYMAELARQRAATRREENGVMPVRKAIIHWRNSAFSVAEAIDLMPGWKPANAYKVLGRRDVPAGRRPNK